MDTFSALLAICAGNSPVPGEFPTQRPVTRSFDIFFDLRLNKWLSKQSWGWWFETPSHQVWHHRNGWPEDGEYSLVSISSSRLLNRLVANHWFFHQISWHTPAPYIWRPFTDNPINDMTLLKESKALKVGGPFVWTSSLVVLSMENSREFQLAMDLQPRSNS